MQRCWEREQSGAPGAELISPALGASSSPEAPFLGCAGKQNCQGMRHLNDLGVCVRMK